MQLKGGRLTNSSGFGYKVKDKVCRKYRVLESCNPFDQVNNSKRFDNLASLYRRVYVLTSSSIELDLFTYTYR